MRSDNRQHGKVLRIAHQIMPGLDAFTHYDRSWLRSDLGAGLSVAAVALPVGIAYADLAGVPAVYGMYSAIFPLLAYALFGSSRQLMTGPDAATCIIVAASLGPLAGGDPAKYLTLMLILTLLTGVLYIVAGFARLGFIANFLSQPILTGYLNGVALFIIAGQLQKLFGYSGEATGFFPKLVEFFRRLDQSHLPTLWFGLGMLAALVVLRRLGPRLPAALFVVVAGIAAVAAMDLDQGGVAVLGNVPAGLPPLHLQHIELREVTELFLNAVGITLVSFTSGVLTAKSFARRNHYEISANQELIAFGACNIASGLAQGFPVTGADSRTAVNNAMGGKTQLVGLTAAAAMLLVLFFLTEPLAYVPTAALAAVIMVSAVGLFDWRELRHLYAVSHRELLLSVATTLGVLILGVLPGVLLAVTLSLLWLLSVVSKPHQGELGRVKGMKGFHHTVDYPEAKTIPGLVIYRFDSNLVFFNADYFRDGLRDVITSAQTPVEWLVVDASPINVIDYSALQKFDEIREELDAAGIVLASARVKSNLYNFFDRDWIEKRRGRNSEYDFVTVNSAVRAFKRHKKKQAKEAERGSD